MSIDHIILEIDGATDYMSSQRALGLDSASCDACQEGILRTILAMLDVLRVLTQPQATVVLQHLPTSTFSDDQKRRIGDAIVTKARGLNANPHIVSGSRCRIEHSCQIQFLFTQSDIALFADPGLMLPPKFHHARERCGLLGMESCSEPLYSDICTFVVAQHTDGKGEPFPTPPVLYGYLQRAKKAFQAVRKSAQIPKLPLYNSQCAAARSLGQCLRD